MEQMYYLMNKNIKLLEFKVYDTPYGELIEEINSLSNLRPIGFTNINDWVINRNYAKHKEHLKKWLKEWEIETSRGFIDLTHCLSINDCLWVKSKDSDLVWENVNLYNNEFSDVTKMTAFDTGLFGLQLSTTHITSPEFTSEGSAPKFWQNENDDIYLYKPQLSGASNFGLEANSEFISSYIINQISNVNNTVYDITRVNNKICSKCRLFTDENYGYIPFYKSFNYFNISENVPENITTKDVLDICKEIGYEEESKKMYLIDSLIFNQDRHLGNFGFIFDNNTFEIIDFAPLYDYNISFLCNALDKDISSLNAFFQYEDEYMLGHKLGGKFSEVGRAVIDNKLNDLIPSTLIIPKHPNSTLNLDDHRIECIIKILENNAKSISGKNINFIYKEIPEHFYNQINKPYYNYDNFKKVK